jgi:hypothetical protein
MKKLRQFSILLLVINFASCNNQPEESQENILVPDETALIDTLSESSEALVPEEMETEPFTVSIDSFTEFPPEIDGCACYFSKTFDAFNLGEYIYMDDFAMENAFMKLNGEMVQFQVASAEWEDNGSGTILVSNADFVVTLSFQQVSSLDETFQKEGDLTINNADGETIVIPFFGECGC